MNKDYWQQRYEDLRVEFETYKIDKDKEILAAKLSATRINYRYSKMLRDIRENYRSGELPLPSEIIEEFNKGGES